MNTVELTSDVVRQHLLDRAKEYATKRNVALSAIAESAVKDSKFLARVSNGENFTIRTYQRVIDWLDEQERAA
jgi:hypothetical protein